MGGKVLVRLGLSVFVTAICFSTLHSQDIPWKSREECSKNFNIEKINLNNKPWSEYNNLFANYFMCRSIVSANVKECDNLINPEPRRRCQEEQKRFDFWVRLISKRNITSDSCGQIPGANRENCGSLIQTFQNRDTSICKGDRNCIAIINLDDSAVTDIINKEIIILMKAIKNSDASLCKKIGDARGLSLAEVCKAVVTGDIKVCQESGGIEEFKKDYCDWLDRQSKLKR